MQPLIEPWVVYVGAKRKLLPQLLPLFPTADRFVDLFAGGGSVWSNVLDRYSTVVANDIIADLIAVQKSIIADPEAVLAELERIKVSKDNQQAYNDLRQLYNEDPTPERLLMLILSCTNNLMRFNKKLKFNQTFGRRTMSETSKEKIRSWARAVKPYEEKIQFSALPFDQFEFKTGDFAFLDPPYPNSEAGYNAYWSKDDDAKLFELLKGLDQRSVKFLLCGFERHGEKSCWLLEAAAEAGFVRTPIRSDYEKVSRAKKSKQTQEVVYTNYKTEQE